MIILYSKYMCVTKVEKLKEEEVWFVVVTRGEYAVRE